MSTSTTVAGPDLAGVATWADLADRTPHGVVVEGIDLVVVRFDENHSVLSGRCQHRGARLADGHCVGDDLVCGLHGWDYRMDSGISTYSDREHLHRFESVIVNGVIHVDRSELVAYRRRHALRVTPEPTLPPDATDEFERFYDDPHVSPEEPLVAEIHELARHGLTRVGHHGPVAAMGVDRNQLPRWDDLQFVTAQLDRFPLLDDEVVDTSVVIGPRASKPLHLAIPMFVSDMSFGAISQEAKTALARGAELAGTGICSGEGGMLPEEQAENSRYFYEMASARFGWRPEILGQVQAFHLKFGQGAKTGTGGHLPGPKVQGRIAEVRGLTPGTPAVSPARFPEWSSLAEIAEFVEWAKSESGGIPVGVKLSAQHIEADLDAAFVLGVDYVILDGRGGGTGAAPRIFRDHISVPTMAALPRARRHIDASGRNEITLIVTGGLRTAPDIAKALALGADAVALANSALQAIGCVGMRACNTDNCPVGIATQKPELRARLPVDDAAQRLGRFLDATTELIGVLARACGHRAVTEFGLDDLTTFDRDLAHLTGVAYGGMAS